MRKPKVENKYNLKPKDIEKAVVLDYERLHKPPFWRNDVVQAWCLSGGSHIVFYGDSPRSYCISFYDEDAKFYSGKIKLYCSSYEGLSSYNFKRFYNIKEIKRETDLKLQERLLETINWLIDEGIIAIN